MKGEKKEGYSAIGHIAEGLFSFQNKKFHSSHLREFYMLEVLNVDEKITYYMVGL